MLATAVRDPLAGTASPFLLTGKRGLIVGVADQRSTAWGVACACRSLGAELALTCRNHKARLRVEPLARSIGADLLLPLDLRNEGELEAVFATIARRWGRLDFLVHAVAFARELDRRVADVSSAAFLEAMELSCWSFIRMARLAKDLMPDGGCLVTYSYLGARQAVPGYNVMGPVKAALEATVRSLAAELAPARIRFHALSLGPLRTRAASGLREIEALIAHAEAQAPLRRAIDIEDAGLATAFLVSDAARHLTGSVPFVDAGFHLVA
jgi:enoyl-[acyl-carrier protein] reductase I